MATRFSLLPLAALVAAGLSFGAASAAAQSEILHLEASTFAMEVTPGGVAQFVVDVTNQSAQDIRVYIVRSQNNLPDTNLWYSTLCFNGTCFSKDMSAPPPATLGPGETMHFELSVQAGNDDNSVGTVTVEFAPGIVGERISKEFTVTVDASASSVGSANDARIADAYPNPATSLVSIPLPAASVAGTIALEICNLRGEPIANLSDAARTAIANGAGKVDVDLSGQPNGRYFYRLLSDGRSRTGTIVIAR